jgi:hypothetical protein
LADAFRVLPRDFHAFCVNFTHPSTQNFSKTKEIRMASSMLKKPHERPGGWE